MNEIDVTVFPTPNPNALKFVLNWPVLEKGKVTFKGPEECTDVPLALNLFHLDGVVSVHLYDNFITVTKNATVDWNELEPQVEETITSLMETHDPSFEIKNPEEERRKKLPEDLQKIEAILDRTIRPGLQGDGGDVECLKFEEDVLEIRYQGACGTCPSSTMGTLEAIKSILSDEMGRPIDVFISGDAMGDSQMGPYGYDPFGAGGF